MPSTSVYTMAYSTTAHGFWLIDDQRNEHAVGARLSDRDVCERPLRLFQGLCREGWDSICQQTPVDARHAGNPMGVTLFRL
jgi:hypothetical protein